MSSWFFWSQGILSISRCIMVLALNRAARYASERVGFGVAIGQNQAIQHPLAERAGSSSKRPN